MPKCQGETSYCQFGAETLIKLLDGFEKNIDGVFENKDSAAQIWVTTDNRRIPVRIKSELPFGSFIAELTSYKEGSKTEDDSH